MDRHPELDAAHVDRRSHGLRQSGRRRQPERGPNGISYSPDCRTPCPAKPSTVCALRAWPLQSMHRGHLHTGDADLMIAGGMEHMTRGPWVMSKASSAFGRDVQMHDTSFGWRFINPKLDALYGTEGMGSTAENLVDLHSISRADQDIFAACPRTRHQSAQEAGHLLQKKLPPFTFHAASKKTSFLLKTNSSRAGTTTAEILAKLRPAFRKEGGSVTAGNSSGLNDGACALLLSNEAGIQQWGLRTPCPDGLQRGRRGGASHHGHWSS